MILTREILEQGKSIRGGWNNNQFRALGVTNFKSGWLKKLIGIDLPEDYIKEFLSLKDAHLKAKDGEFKKPNVRVRVHDQGRPRFVYCPPNFPYKDQYTHPNWQKMRLFILNRDNFKCVDCKTKDSTLHVHHLRYLKSGFIWDVPTWYLVTLCEVCHSKEHNRDLTIAGNK